VQHLLPAPARPFPCANPADGGPADQPGADRGTTSLIAETGLRPEIRPDRAVNHLPGQEDGPEAGRGFVLRHGLPYGVGMVSANALGALVTFVYAVVIIAPGPERQAHGQLRLNALVFGVFLLVSLLIGYVWSVRRFGSTLAWLLADRWPSETERAITLRQPTRQTVVHATLWAVGIVLFFALNVGYSPKIALDVALATALGGLFTTALGFLLAERLLRPVTTLALRFGGPDTPAVAGVVSRVVWAWTVGTGVPVAGVGLALLGRGTADRLTDDTPALLLLIVAVLVSLATMLLLARSIAEPATPIRRAVRAMADGDVEVTVPVTIAGEIGRLESAVNDMAASLRESKQLQDLFGRQVGIDVARQALARGVELGGESHDIAVLFVDLNGSTAFASEHAPLEVVSLLNIFFRVVVDVVDEHGGVINKFAGDGALCVFGAPLPHPDPASAALAAGRTLRRRVAELDHEQIGVGVGISAGTVIAGNVGAESRFEYTVIGDPVNEASRLTDLAKERDEGLLAAATVLDRAEPDEVARWRVAETVELAGRNSPTRLAVLRQPWKRGQP
jgi:adenylate cyclase